MAEPHASSSSSSNDAFVWKHDLLSQAQHEASLTVPPPPVSAASSSPLTSASDNGQKEAAQSLSTPEYASPTDASLYPAEPLPRSTLEKVARAAQNAQIAPVPSASEARQVAQAAAEYSWDTRGKPERTLPLLPGEDDALATLLLRRHTVAPTSSILQQHAISIMDSIRTSAWLFLTARGAEHQLSHVESPIWIQGLFIRHPELFQSIAPTTSDGALLTGSDPYGGIVSPQALACALFVLAVASSGKGQAGEAPPKRPRGRPRKIKMENPNPPPKRPRGRPRKIRGLSPPKFPKKRGRPPKVRPTGPVVTQDPPVIPANSGHPLDSNHTEQGQPMRLDVLPTQDQVSCSAEPADANPTGCDASANDGRTDATAALAAFHSALQHLQSLEPPVPSS